MHSIHCNFTRIPDVAAVDLIDAWGVYVLWDGKAIARPAYIGEGSIWQRFLEHRDWTSRPFDGYVAVLSEKYSEATKRDLQIVEFVLLRIARETDRLPPQNAKEGNISMLNALFRSHGVVRVHVGGFDPLQDPKFARPLRTKKIANIRYARVDELELEDDWRLRRKR